MAYLAIRIGTVIKHTICFVIQNLVFCSHTMHIYTGCPGGNVQDFGRMFLTLKYTDLTQNTYIRS